MEERNGGNIVLSAGRHFAWLLPAATVPIHALAAAATPAIAQFVAHRRVSVY